MPGTAQLDATARAKPIPESLLQTTNSPSAALTAVHTYGFEGHGPSDSPPSNGANLAMNSSSLMAGELSAQAPISARTSSAGRFPEAASSIFVTSVVRSGAGPVDGRTVTVPARSGAAISAADRPS